MNTKGRIFLIAILLISFVASQAQQTFKLIQESNSVIINGTSSMHDWKMKASKMESIIEIELNNSELKKINKANFICHSKSIKGDSRIMNDKTSDALKAEKYPEIKFVQVSLDNLKNSNGLFTGDITGDLSLAGKTKRIKVPFKGKILNNKTLSIETTVNVDMKEYGIDPPTAMFGALKTGKDVKIEFRLKYIDSGGLGLNEKKQ
ncbi:MAG: YceI family protein [Bacteroidales bacterium]|nr:YceI family protein [Bacteroidales bacterium]